MKEGCQGLLGKGKMDGKGDWHWQGVSCRVCRCCSCHPSHLALIVEMSAGCAQIPAGWWRGAGRREVLAKGSGWRCASTDNEASNTGAWDNTEGSAVHTLPQSCLICARIPHCCISTGGLHIQYMMNMSIPVPCTFLVTADKFRSSLFIYILVPEHVEHSCKTLGQRTSFLFLWYFSKNMKSHPGKDFSCFQSTFKNKG